MSHQTDQLFNVRWKLYSHRNKNLFSCSFYNFHRTTCAARKAPDSTSERNTCQAQVLVLSFSKSLNFARDIISCWIGVINYQFSIVISVNSHFRYRCAKREWWSFRSCMMRSLFSDGQFFFTWQVGERYIFVLLLLFVISFVLYLLGTLFSLSLIVVNESMKWRILKYSPGLISHYIPCNC